MHKIKNTGWSEYSTWNHSSTVKALYRQRSRKEVEEMTCHIQAAKLLASECSKGDAVLDVGCGSAYLYHSLEKLNLSYFGIDPELEFIKIAKDEMLKFGLQADNLLQMRIEDFSGSVDHVFSINVLTYLDNFHRPLERMLKSANKTVILRESIAENSSCHYVVDDYLDQNVKLKTYINTYSISEIVNFINDYGFEVQEYVDDYSGGKMQEVIGYPHHWKFIVAKKIS